MDIIIDYKDNALDIIEKINELLKPEGYKLIFDAEEYDGYEVVKLEKI